MLDWQRAIDETKTVVCPLLIYNDNGTYEAPVQIYDESKGKWVDKAKPSTFFDPRRSEAKIESEVSEAFKSKVEAPSGNGWEGTTPTGIKIQFYWDEKNQRTTFHPIGDQ